MLFSGGTVMRSFVRCLSRAALCAVLSAVAVPAAAATLTVDAHSRGCYKGAGSTFCIGSGTATGNYFLGHVPGPGEIRNYFSFDLGDLSGSVLDAALYLDTRGNSVDYISPDATETYALFDVADGSLLGGGMAPAGFADLGSGVSYGSAMVTNAVIGTTLEIELNSAALAAIHTAAGGTFSIGGAITTLAGSVAQESLFGSTNGSAYRTRLVLTVADQADTFAVPAPEVLAISGAGMIAFALIRMLFWRPARPPEEADPAPVSAASVPTVPASTAAN